jgi:hypothetical protein
MQTVSCPSCGAPVKFRSHAAVMAVCEYCSASVLKDADSVKDIGKMSSVLEDFSPIQIGTAGSIGGGNFNVIGRIQLRYDAGMWNEWYLLFDSGETAWLGDSSGMFTVTRERKVSGALPAFDEIEPGKLYSVGSDRFTASEKRVAQCIGGQGELPFKVGEGWQAKVADFRAGPTFLTLDYSDGELPMVFSGRAVTLDEMKCQLLREDEQIKASAGKYRGKLDALDCPSCGGMIKYMPGLATNLVCPSCSSQLDAAGPEAVVLAAGEAVEKERTSIPLGVEAKINGNDYTVIGVMKRADDEGTEWSEYLLYSTKASFFWLVETDEGWSRASVMPSWPTWHWTGSDNALLDNVTYNKKWEYPATVRYVAGAFNWRVQRGDVVRVFEFENGVTSLAAELTPHELTWSRSTPVAFDQIKAWFGANLRAGEPVKSGSGESLDLEGVMGNAGFRKFAMWIIGLNIIPLLFNFGDTFETLLIALVALYGPALYFANKDKLKNMEGSDDE